MKKFTKNLIAGALLSTALVSASAMAEQKIAVVDVQQVLSAMPEVAVIQQTIADEFKDTIQTLEAKQKEFQFLMEKRQREMATMSEQQIKDLEDQIIALRGELEAEGPKLQQAMRGRQNEEQNKLLLKIRGAIDEVSSKQDYDLIFNAGSVVFAKEQFDISQQVLEQVSKAN